MISDFEKSVIDILNKDGLSAKKYFGELSDPKNFKFATKEMPLIFLDFIGDSPENPIRDIYKFNLYIAHISYSKNESTRSSKHYELYDLLQEINTRLSYKSFLNSEPIKMGKSEKIFDSVVSAGYLTVFKREFTTIFKKENI
ncbi:hypothetical protein [Sulfurimonas sp.]|uniref:hypothetical protein n=1 Tax=Sulfurimonas sp. TaxID=2022749 RepID=UPI0025FA78ED|nr:hypothetical protein [Sulfurimonas sp.]